MVDKLLWFLVSPVSNGNLSKLCNGYNIHGCNTKMCIRASTQCFTVPHLKVDRFILMMPIRHHGKLMTLINDHFTDLYCFYLLCSLFDSMGY